MPARQEEREGLQENHFKELGSPASSSNGIPRGVSMRPPDFLMAASLLLAARNGTPQAPDGGG